MKKKKTFWIFFIIWSILNVSLLVMAVYDVFGKFNKTTEEFWPFTVGSPKYYDFLELLVYLAIPLIVYYLSKLVQYYHQPHTHKTE